MNLLNGLDRGMGFFYSVKQLGKNLLFLMGLASMVFFWIFIASYYEPLRAAAILMIRVINSGVVMFTSGLIVYYFLYFWKEYVFNKRMKQLTAQISTREQSFNGKNKKRRK